MACAEPKFYDVAVIGAGPAGCSAAQALAQRGFVVVVLERASLPRYKTCGGGVLGRAHKLLPNEASRAVEREFRSVALNFFDSGLRFVAMRATPLVYMTMRADLDCLLARHAEAHGAQLKESCRVLNITKHADFVEISSDAGTFQAKFVIAADGVHSMTAKAAGWSGLPQLAPALEWEVHLKEEDFERFKDTARFDFNFIEAGYAWIFPKREHLSVGILSTQRRSLELQAKLQQYLRHLGIIEIQKCERHGYLIPIAPRREKLAKDRVLLVGDAAGLADPVTAEGISYAIISGQLAARALTECDLEAAHVSTRYDALLRDIVLEELRAAKFLANFLYNYPRLRNRIFRQNGKRLTEFVAGAAMGENSYREALRSPLNYLKMIWPARQLLY